MTNRRVQQFGYKFLYDQDSGNDNSIPEWFGFILERLEESFRIKFDQISATEFNPGDFYSPHIDSHSSFEDTIIILSLLSPSSINFRHPDGTDHNQFLPRRSILEIKGEARYL